MLLAGEITQQTANEAKITIQETASDVDQVKRSSGPAVTVVEYSFILTGNQFRQDLRKWLSPPDPSTNHNIARKAHHDGTATWFFQGGIFKEWRSAPSLLWIHGKRTFPPSLLFRTPTNSCLPSGLRQERYLVRRFSNVVS